MFSLIRRVAMAMALTAIVAASAAAQQYGAQLNFGTESDLGVGARAEFSLANKLSKEGPLSQAFVIAAFDYYFMDCAGLDCTYWEINPSLAVPMKAGTMNAYVGAGINYASMTLTFPGFGEISDSQTGLNLLGGLKFPLAGQSAFAEARVGLGGGEQIALSFGFLFGGAP